MSVYDSKQGLPGVYAKDQGLSQYMTQIMTWMALGVGLTSFMAFVTLSSQTMLQLVFGTPLFYILILAEFGLVIGFGVALRKSVSMPVLFGMFLSYAALNGVTLSVVLLVYTSQSVLTAFLTTTGMFGATALYGYVTKKDLTGLGGMARMALFGLIIGMIVNIFLANSFLEYAISGAGILIFTVLTAYDTQKLKEYYLAHSQDKEALKRVSLGGALTLYLDFINLFLMLLRLLGNRR